MVMAMRQRLTLESCCSELIASWGHRALVSSSSGHVGQAASGHREKVWRDFFSDPSQWWDCRLEKVNARYPDFKHKKTQDALWLGDCRNPLWVAAEVAAMAPGTVQMGSFSWNRRLAKYVKAGEYEKTMELFKQMQKKGMRPDRFTFLPVLNACAHLRALEEGRQAHELIMQTGCEADVFVGSSLVDMYAKCGHMEDALRVFNKMPSRDVVTWSALILGHVKYGQGQKALELFRQMQQEGVHPDTVTYVGVLNACVSIMALGRGQGQKALDIFQQMQEGVQPDTVWAVVCWNAMIFVHVKCGEGHKALELFQKMLQEGVQPDAVTYVGVLNACASIMALEEGRRAHEHIIQSDCESTVCLHMMCSLGMPYLEDLQCMGRVRKLWYILNGCVKKVYIQEAENIIQGMPCKPDAAVWIALLGACRIHGNLEMGECVAKRVLELEPKIAAGYVWLSNMYAATGNLELSENVE
ncbi:hypothetical protein BDL97_07G055400 [Sphagnum fallax]|nr:hypothetical protein BDL97_07G055400 [Sphagnum fallax]